MSRGRDPSAFEADPCRIVSCLVEGNSIRSTCRMTGAAKGTVLKLLADLGAACLAFHDAHVRSSRYSRYTTGQALAEPAPSTRAQKAQGPTVWRALGELHAS